MTRKAAQIGLPAIAFTEHTPKMPGSCGKLYFSNFKVLPRENSACAVCLAVKPILWTMTEHWICRTHCLKNGHRYCKLSYSMYLPRYKGAEYAGTGAGSWNPLVDIIGHPDDSRYPVDFETVVRAAKQNNKFLELNNTSLKPDGPRSGARENDLCMLKLCMEHGVMITLGSDAHVEEDICNFRMRKSC